MAILTTTQNGLNFTGGTTYIQTGTTTLMAIATNGDVQFSQYGAGTLVTDASGNISVSSGGGAGGPYLPLAGGTMTGNLNINTSTNFPLLFTGTNTNYTAIGIKNTGSGDAGIYMDGINGDFGGSDYAFIGQKDEGYLLYNIGANSPLPYHVFTGGNVGINSTAPGNKLTIVDALGTNFSDAILGLKANVAITASTRTAISLATSTVNNFGVTLNGIRQGSSSGEPRFGINMHNNSAGGSEAFTIKSSGDVGIGITSPASRFEVYGGNSGVNDVDRYIRFKASNGEKRFDFYVGGTGNASSLGMYTSDGTTKNVQISSGGTSYFNGGNVGIGLTNPNSTLEVDGTINFNASGDRGFICNPGQGTFSLGDIDEIGGGAYITTNNTNIDYYAAGVITGRLEDDGTLTVTGDMVAYGSPSDKRLKENIKPIESALDKAMKLQGVTFDWKESDSILNIKEDIGFIAQDVQKVVPELVRENADGMLSMRHQGIAPILLEAIKELKAEIEELKKQIK